MLYLTVGKVIHIPANFNEAGLATEATLSDLNSKHNTLGQKESNGSMPVVLSKDQEEILAALASGNQVRTIISSLNALVEQQMLTNNLLKAILE